MFGATIFAKWLLPSCFEKSLENNNKNNKFYTSDEKISTTKITITFDLNYNQGVTKIQKQLYGGILWKKLTCNYIRIRQVTPTHAFCCDFCSIYWEILFHREYLRKTASENFNLSFVFRSSFIQKICFQRIALIESF